MIFFGNKNIKNNKKIDISLGADANVDPEGWYFEQDVLMSLDYIPEWVIKVKYFPFRCNNGYKIDVRAAQY